LVRLTGIDYLRLVCHEDHADLADQLRPSALDGRQAPPGNPGQGQKFSDP
jgi:hypothetical protein